MRRRRSPFSFSPCSLSLVIVDFAQLGLHGHVLDRFRDDLLGVHELEREVVVGILEARQLGERVDHADHHLGARGDALDGHHRRLRERAEHPRAEQLPVAVEDGQRPAELVHGDRQRRPPGRRLGRRARETVLERRDARRGEALPDRLDVVGGGRRQREGLLGVESLLAHRLGGHLAERGEVARGPARGGARHPCRRRDGGRRSSGRKSSAVSATSTALTNWRGPRARSSGCAGVSR